MISRIVVSEDMIELNGFSIYQHSSEWEITNGDFSDVFPTFEQATAYCLENKDGGVLICTTQQK